MKHFLFLLIISCSHQNSKIDTSPPLPAEVPIQEITKPKDDLSAAIDQTKSYFCIKNDKRFNKEISCKSYSESMHAKCSRLHQTQSAVLKCLEKLLKV